MKFKVPPGRLLPAADPRFALLRPFGKHARLYDSAQRMAAIDYRTGEVIVSDAQTLDVFGEHYVTEELANGNIGVYRRHYGLEASIAVDGR